MAHLLIQGEIAENLTHKLDHFRRVTSIQAMSAALEDVCKALSLNNGDDARRVMAIRIVELVRRGETDPIKLRDRVLREAGGDTE